MGTFCNTVQTSSDVECFHSGRCCYNSRVAQQMCSSHRWGLFLSFVHEFGVNLLLEFFFFSWINKISTIFQLFQFAAAAPAAAPAPAPAPASAAATSAGSTTAADAELRLCSPLQHYDDFPARTAQRAADQHHFAAEQCTTGHHCGHFHTGPTDPVGRKPSRFYK